MLTFSGATSMSVGVGALQGFTPLEALAVFSYVKRIYSPH